MTIRKLLPPSDIDGFLGGIAENEKWKDLYTEKINGKTPSEFVAAETPKAHDLDAHGSVTLAELNTKISDATIPSDAAATTSVAGLVELATDAEMLSMTAGTVITASNLAAWARTGTVTVTVGPTGCDYTTLNAAITALCKRYPGHGATATIDVAEDFVMAEQVLVTGQNLGWITISGTNPDTARTIIAPVSGPAFSCIGGTLPTVSVAWVMGESNGQSTGSVVGVRCSLGGRGVFLKGIKNVKGRVAEARDGGYLYLTGDWSGGTGDYGVLAQFNGTVTIIGNYQRGASPNSNDACVFYGGLISVHQASVGGISQTKNVISGGGIIFDAR